MATLSANPEVTLAPPGKGGGEPPLPPAESAQTLIVAGHEISVFAESPPLFEAMLRDIRGARERVWLETYIFFNDDGGKRIAEAIKEKARAGLDVRVMYDAPGSALTPASLFGEMAAVGVKVHAYHSLLEGLRRFKPLTILNRRDHRKLLIVDGAADGAGYFGGMNIIDNVENVRQQKAENRPSSSGWRDVHLRLSGPQQCELAESFERNWARCTGSGWRGGRRNGCGHSSCTWPAAMAGRNRFGFSTPGLRTRYSRAARVYARMIRRARRQITLSMAYFIPVGAVLREMLRRRKRRVGVRVIVPGKSDVRLVQLATSYLYDRLLRRGLRIYERRHRMLHSKVMIVDDLYTVVGSANLDPRSLYTNLEFLAVIRSRALARVMERICRFEISQSERITTGYCRRLSRWQRILNRVAWMLRWWL